MIWICSSRSFCTRVGIKQEKSLALIVVCDSKQFTFVYCSRYYALVARALWSRMQTRAQNLEQRAQTCTVSSHTSTITMRVQGVRFLTVRYYRKIHSFSADDGEWIPQNPTSRWNSFGTLVVVERDINAVSESVTRVHTLRYISLKRSNDMLVLIPTMINSPWPSITVIFARNLGGLYDMIS